MRERAEAKERAKALVTEWLDAPTIVERGKPLMVRGGFPVVAFDNLSERIEAALLAAYRAGQEAMQREAHRVAGVVEWHDCPRNAPGRSFLPCLDCAYGDGRQAAADAIRALPLEDEHDE